MNNTSQTSSVFLGFNSNIAELSFLQEQQPVNSIDAELMTQMDALLDRVQQQRGVEGLILFSKKPGSFLAGADLHMLDQVDQASQAQAISAQGHALIQRIEDLPFPVVAVIDGACFGGGLEMSLACDARICSDNKATRFGLPELRMGLIPGAGGTQRLPAMIGLEPALDLMLHSPELSPQKAQQLGLIDGIFKSEHLLRAARQKIRQLRDKKTEKVSVGDRLKFWQHLQLGRSISDNLVSSKLLINQTRERIQAETHGHYPAPFALLRVVETGLEQGFAAGLQAEAEAWGQLVVSPESRQLRRVYFLGRKALRLDDATKKMSVPRRLGLLGCGRVGSDIALLASAHGQNLRIVERDRERLLRSQKSLHQRILQRHSDALRTIDAQRQHARMSFCTDMSGLRSRALLLEAVADKIDDKQQALSRLAGVTQDQQLLISSSAYLPLAKLKKALPAASRLINMHFLRPMQHNPLVEMVVHRDTPPQDIALGRAWLHSLGKRSVVVYDGPAYYTTRSLMAYLLEALRVLEEGAAIDDIDRVMHAAGMQQGPFKLLDRLGLDQTLRIVELLQSTIPKRFAIASSLRALSNDGRFGIKNQRGFYHYDGGRRGEVDHSVYDLLTGGQRRRPIDEKQVQQRLLLSWVNSAQDCLDDGVLQSADDGDLLAVSGLGFPAYLGGPFEYLRQRGLEQTSDKLQRLQQLHGDRFAPATGIATSKA